MRVPAADQLVRPGAVPAMPFEQMGRVNFEPGGGISGDVAGQRRLADVAFAPEQQAAGFMWQRGGGGAAHLQRCGKIQPHGFPFIGA